MSPPNCCSLAKAHSPFHLRVGVPTQDDQASISSRLGWPRAEVDGEPCTLYSVSVIEHVSRLPPDTHTTVPSSTVVCGSAAVVLVRSLLVGETSLGWVPVHRQQV